MTHPSTSPVTVAPIGNWDRLAIIALGSAGCALSYDALQQMAVAIHVRGYLTYLFPLVIDGFIAYGVRALLVLSTAPLRARAYVWMLFGTATTASIWANSLHAVRLNQQTTHGGLRLGDTVVAILSTLAPLALAGAVHLYILITRHRPPNPAGTAGPAGDHDLSVPAPPPTLGAASPGDRTSHRDHPGDSRPGPSRGPGIPTGGDRPTGPHSQTHGIELGRDGDRRELGTGSGTGDSPHTQADPVPESNPATVPTVSVPEGRRPDKAKMVVPGTEMGTGPEADHVAGTGHGPGTGGGDQGRTDTVPETVPTSSGRHRGPGPAGGADGTGDRSPANGTVRSLSRARLSEDEIVARIRPHVPAVLERTGNETITRVQLRQIMRDQQISIRNENLTPVLHRLRGESGLNAKRSSTR